MSLPVEVLNTFDAVCVKLFNGVFIVDIQDNKCLDGTSIKFRNIGSYKADDFL